MKKSVAIIISPNYKDYAKKYLAECIESVRAQDYEGEVKVFLTDNETSAESVEFLRKTAPELELILNNTNDGYAKGVNDALRLALQAGFDYLAIINIHAVIEPAYITEMVKALESDKKIGVAQGLMLMPDRKTISSLGNETHFLGFGYCRGYKEKISNPPAVGAGFKSASRTGRFQIRQPYGQVSNYNLIHYPSGSSMIFRREVLEEVGLLDEEYWMYNEDQELGWRLLLSGYKCVLTPKAIMYNKYEFQRSIKKFYWMDRNRILAILQCYKLPTLVLIFPAFVVMEAGLILFSLKSGWFKEKMRVWAYFFSFSTWQYIIRARRRNQTLRKVSDNSIAELISGRIWYQEVDDWKLRFINPIFDFYWKMCKYIMFW